MKGYFVKSTRVTPSIYFNPKKNLLDIRGKSTPENPLAFYQYVFSSLDEYCNSVNGDLHLNLAFEYFNTSSSKCLYMLLKKANMIHAKGKKVVINWYYETEDEDMCEAGEDLSCLFNFDFKMIEIPEIIVLGTVAETSNKETSFSA